ncbi:hypothetical protein PG999_012297 [Apiospora kogelbergensis]|uniref:Uncharacterized protein n=1 Tax=Apiospora kogelbergensis TaxID=1337665 RepID=A0AAW0QU42_9PEZI
MWRPRPLSTTILVFTQISSTVSVLLLGRKQDYSQLIPMPPKAKKMTKEHHDARVESKADGRGREGHEAGGHGVDDARPRFIGEEFGVVDGIDIHLGGAVETRRAGPAAAAAAAGAAVRISFFVFATDSSRSRKCKWGTKLRRTNGASLMATTMRATVAWHGARV